MKKFYGVHFYVNINNLNSIVKKDEKKYEDLARSFRALEVFIKSMEKFALDIGDIEIEKFTTSRLHFYTMECEESSILKMLQVICFANSLADYMHSNIGKFNNMDKFTIGDGADLGEFTEFEFSDPDSGITEMTTIGSPANRAAKLQSNCSDGEILISREVYDSLPRDIKSEFFGDGILSAKLAKKYAELTVYKANYSDVEYALPKQYYNRKDNALDYAKEQANDTNIGEIDFSGATTQIDFTNLSLKNSKHLTDSAVLYADIRGFTNKVDEGHLPDIKQLVQIVLKGMNKCVRQYDGTHVQLQGDRESAVFNSFSKETDNFALRALFSAMRMIDMVNDVNEEKTENRLDIGIGVSLGNIFATKVGLKKHKDNVIMGETVKEADITEDNVAGINNKTELVITSDCYEYIINLKDSCVKTIKAIFSQRRFDNKLYYVCSMGYKQFQKKLVDNNRDQNANNAKRNTDLKPWSKE